MKKVLFSLFFICIFMVSAFADYTVDSIAVTAEAEASGKTAVTTVLQVTFDSPTEEVVYPLPQSDVSRVSAGDFSFDVEKSDKGIDVILENSAGFVGTQTFMITYTVPAGVYADDDGEHYSLGILSSRLGKDVASCSFQITMPAPFEAETQVVSGYHGTLGQSDTGLVTEGNVLRGSADSRMAYDSLRADLILPEGYFRIRSNTIPVVSITWLAVGMVAVLILTYVYWRLKIRTSRVNTSTRLLTPEGLLPCHLSQVLDGITCDIPALILEWANQGYLSIALSRRGTVVLMKNMDMGSERSRAEQKLFLRIFGSRLRVPVTPGRYAKAAALFRASSRKSLNRIMLDRTGGNLLLVQFPCRVLLAVGIGYILQAALPEGAGFTVLAVLAGLAGYVYSIHLHAALQRFFLRGTTDRTFFGVTAVLGVLIFFALLAGALPEMLVGTVACAMSAFLGSRGPRRSKWGVDALSQTRGCRSFFRQVTWQKLQVYQGRDRYFFQKQLPKAVALGVERRFARRFEDIPVPLPHWLYIPAETSLSAMSLYRELQPILRQLRAAF